MDAGRPFRATSHELSHSRTSVEEWAKVWSIALDQIAERQEVKMLRITEARRHRGWSQAQLARSARIDQANLSKYESGRLRPYAAQLRRIARALGWPVQSADALLEEVTTLDQGAKPWRWRRPQPSTRGSERGAVQNSTTARRPAR